MRDKNTEKKSKKNQQLEKKSGGFLSTLVNVFVSNNFGLFFLALIAALAYAISKG